LHLDIPVGLLDDWGEARTRKLAETLGLKFLTLGKVLKKMYKSKAIFSQTDSVTCETFMKVARSEVCETAYQRNGWILYLNSDLDRSATSLVMHYMRDFANLV